jgi:hypothetical protein
MRNDRCRALFVLLACAWIAGSAFPARAQESVLQSVAQAAPGRVLNVASFGASGSLATVNVVVARGSTAVAIAGDPAGFAPGNAVTILRAGPPPAVATPGGVTGRAIGYDDRGLAGGPCRVDGRNPRCDARWTWRISAVDSGLGASAPSGPLVVEHAPAAPNPANRIRLLWNSDPAAVSYLVYGCPGEGCTPSLRAVLPNNWYIQPDGHDCAGCARPRFMTYDYIGHDFGVDEIGGKAMPPGPRNQSLHATIRSIGGRTLQLSAAAAVSAATRMLHDDAPAFQAAIDRLRRISGVQGAGGIIVIPPGHYPIGETLDFYLASGIRFAGLGAPGSTLLVWHGGAGGTVASLNQARECILENFTVTDFPGGSTPGVIVDIDKYDRGEGIRSITTHDELRNLDLERSGIAVRVGNRSNSNCEMMEFRNVMIDSAYNGEGGWYGYYFGGGGETYDERIDGGSIALRDAALFLNSVGSLDSYVLNLSHNYIDWYANGFASWHVVETGSDSELAAQHLYVAYSHAHGLYFTIANSRLVTGAARIASNGYYIVDNASRGLAITGNLIGQQAGAAAKVMFSNGNDPQAPLLSVRNQYQDPHPFATPPGVRMALVSIEDVGSTGSRGIPISPPIDPAAASLMAALMRSANGPPARAATSGPRAAGR